MTIRVQEGVGKLLQTTIGRAPRFLAVAAAIGLMAASGVAQAGQGQQATYPILTGTVTADWSWEPAVVPGEPVAIAPPELIRSVIPAFPSADATRRGYQGHVIVEATIDVNGRITGATIVRSPAAEVFDQAVIDALGQWSFRPASVGGVPVAVTGIFTVRFQIESPEEPQQAEGDPRAAAVQMGTEGLVAPVLIRSVLPEYPDAAAEVGIRGDVYIEAVVTRSGSIVEPVLVRGLADEELNRRALAAIREWRFEPGSVGGQPVDVLALFTVTFRTQ